MLTTSSQRVDKRQLADLYRFFDEKNETIYQEQILDYYAKLQQQMLHLCFSGHFSAGKSTLINHLMNEALLPQSPIPTSANIVEIQKGDEGVIVHFLDQPAIKMKALPPMDRLHQLCRDGDEVKKIEIFKNMEALPEGVTFMDTPGIDAANDADRLMTESALHQVDVLFYVMDYNHVQSEVNARFLKQMDEMNKPYYVIINQMDKHDEAEITISDFKDSLKHVFEQWGISPEQVFYTSMYDTGKEINQFNELRKTINQLITANHQNLLQDTLSHGTEYSVFQGIQEKQKQMDDRLTVLEDGIDDIVLPAASYEEVQDRYQTLEEKKKNIEKEYSHEVEQTTKNAQLVPYEIREKAEQLLHSFDPKFKVGLFRNRKKIESERDERLAMFYQAIKEKAEVSLEWKLRDKMSEFLKPYVSVHFSDPIFEQQFQANDLVKLMNEGATVNGDYILVYTDQVAAAIKKMYRQFYKNKWHELRDRILSPVEEQLSEKKRELETIERYQTIQAEMNQIKHEFNDYKNNVESILRKELTFGEDELHAIEKELDARIVDKVLDITEIPQKAEETKTEKQYDSQLRKDNDTPLYSFNETITDVEQSDHLFKGINGLGSIRQEILRKKERLSNRSFTIALFGAFSAGKSSFANALIGEKVLPVSPNPTTAAINKISPVRDNYQHKDVYVVIKQEQELLADIQEIVEEEFQNLSKVYKWIQKTKLDRLDIADQHKSFLTAFYSGFNEMQRRIGTEYVIDFIDFQRYIREEEIACFVKEMELFYDCPLTEKQITLVDTPGADSVNARHTDLAFSYIKDADAILFVTYYNHPFSKPDQQFLERLGKVKDAFELDKMFFIINAIDLAKDEQEGQLVVDYVRNELHQFDIKDPRMFSVSSKKAIEEKSERTGLPQFEQSFYRFVKEELTQMSMRSIYTDMHRANALVTNWLSIINGDQAEKERLVEQGKTNQKEIESVIKERDHHSYLEHVIQKLTKQTFYAKQRFSIQFVDLFKDYVNPGAIQSSGRKGKKEVETALAALWKAIDTRLKHEYQAISIRLEQSFNQSLQQMRQDIQNKIKQVDLQFSLSEVEDIYLPQADLHVRQREVDKNLLTNWGNTYKDSKSFFAGNGRKELEEYTGKYFGETWEEAVTKMEKDLVTFYQEQWKHHDQVIWEQFYGEVNTYYHQVIAGIEDQEENKEQLIEIKEHLGHVLNSKLSG
ncbi:small GTP-binding protein domain-containing protein [Gracilibacillus orientalis]|uniref:Small GTP-binding protein domain-containing protein n=1 Tax=Gracilibacillus orientalis TaxID=334253 RepID=A0A1I4QAP3_9BACI|nr:dynamin family protein [Gracilibacillus orientalis]SFM37104.1 small GTP-binding protein domain-containing protein [Gracilibacillus orientalis]